MDLAKAIVLGLVQGATEFLPISSSGHLVLVPWLTGWAQPGLAFDAFLHLGTLVAVVLYFRRELARLVLAWLASLRERRLAGDENRRRAWLILIATLPAAILGVALEDFFAGFFADPQAVSLFLLATAGILFSGEKLHAITTREEGLAKLSIGDALLIGLAQAVAILPGISRSGATISAGLWRGMSREESARFSFLLSVPVVFGAGGVKLWELWQQPQFGDLAPVLLGGFLAALASGYLAVRFLLAFLQKRSLYPFAIYCLFLGFTTLILSFLPG